MNRPVPSPGRVRQFAAAARGPIAAVAAFDTHVEVWNIDFGSRLSSFDTVLDFGGRRLALDADGGRVVAAGYDRHGVACYDTRTGEELWRRPELTQVQHLSTEPSGSVAFACSDIRACHVLSLQSGATLETLRGVRAVFVSSHSDHRLLSRAKPVVEPGGTFKRETFAILDVAFSPEVVVVSESGGPVRAFRLEPFGELWRVPPRPGRHWLQVGYSPQAAEFLGVEWNYQDGGPFVLGGFTKDGSWTARAVMEPAAAMEFCRWGSRLLLSDGRVIDTSSGFVVSVLPFGA